MRPVSVGIVWVNLQTNQMLSTVNLVANEISRNDTPFLIS